MNTLYTKLAVVLFILFGLTGTAFIIASLYSSHMYQQEVSQRLNKDLAMYIVNERVLIENGQINQQDLKTLFHTVMIINPSLELYLLDPQGGIRAYSAAPTEIHHDRVSLAPINAMLNNSNPKMPLLGDDPRGNGKKAFSVAAIDNNNERQGYIYAILGSERVDHITELLQSSYIMRWTAAAIGIALLFAFMTGLFIFSLLTQRLRALSRTVDEFKKSDFKQALNLPIKNKKSYDEIDLITQTFNQMSLRIQQQISSLREVDALRRELVANVSHDLRTPLASLKGYLETLLLKEQTLSENQRRHYIEIAYRHSDKLSKLVIELFELAKLDANEVKPQREFFSIGELIHDALQKFQLRAEQQKINFQIAMDPSNHFVEADISMIERVLDNLIDNALKHTPDEGTIKLSVSSNDQHVIIKIADTGYGIPADELPHIFKRYYRKPGKENAAQSGAGLGLAIAQRIIELHGSALSVSSVPQQGTVFDFSLPAADLSPA